MLPVIRPGIIYTSHQTMSFLLLENILHILCNDKPTSSILCHCIHVHYKHFEFSFNQRLCLEGLWFNSFSSENGNVNKCCHHHLSDTKFTEPHCLRSFFYYYHSYPYYLQTLTELSVLFLIFRFCVVAEFKTYSAAVSHYLVNFNLLLSNVPWKPKIQYFPYLHTCNHFHRTTHNRFKSQYYSHSRIFSYQTKTEEIKKCIHFSSISVYNQKLSQFTGVKRKDHREWLLKNY